MKITHAAMAAAALLATGLASGTAYAERPGGKLEGSGPIASHNYRALANRLDSHPVSCGIPGSTMDLSRITAVEGLTGEECGTVLKVTNALDPSKFEYVMAVDQGGLGLDLNTEAFSKLFGTETGRWNAHWEVVNSHYGDGIVTDTSHLPGYQKNLDLPR
ncbi:hypothetical protein ACLF6K_00165 [Streptomyces xanthophaeus]|uniref:hypothetical protein n=1 Tax=Streptomyces xanthophaeus TaxID=67385 RepID=UPI003990367A